eukprot:COSAG02_NODE_3980_length_5959_cov_4.500512_6_plen_37_part_01
MHRLGMRARMNTALDCSRAASVRLIVRYLLLQVLHSL